MKKYLDLTHRIEQNMPVFPGDLPPEIREVTTLGKDIYSVQSISFNNHIGTHLDAPSHFIEGGMTVEQIPLVITHRQGGHSGLHLQGEERPHHQKGPPSPRISYSSWLANAYKDRLGRQLHLGSLLREFSMSDPGGG